MKIPNYDIKEDVGNYKQLYQFMPDRCFRMLICGPSGSGKTNSLLHMIMNLLYFNKCHLYAKNLKQSKYEYLMKTFKPISKEVGYDILEVSNDEIQPVSEINGNNQKLLIFHDFVCEKNQVLLINYFIRGRHKNCSVIYLSQSYYKTRRDIRLNCSHFCVYKFPPANERSLLCRENNIPKEMYEKATNDPYSFLYIDKLRKFTAKNFNERL